MLMRFRIFVLKLGFLVRGFFYRLFYSGGYIGNGRFLTCTAHGKRMILDSNDISISPHLIINGHWEGWITKAFLRLVKEGMVVVDVGANVGYYSILAGGKIKAGGKLISFEANPEIYDILFSNIEINGLLGFSEVVNKAVVDRSRELTFNVYHKHKGSSSLWEDNSVSLRYNDCVEPIKVLGVSLDEYFPVGTKIDLLKIDAEGSEPLIFKGAERVLVENERIIVIIEFAPDNLKSSGGAFQFLEKIKELGFSIFSICKDGSLRASSDEEILNSPHSELVLVRDERYLR